MNNKRVYLGDGLYADFDGYMVTLSTRRGDGLHYVGLEYEVAEALFEFLGDIGWLKEVGEADVKKATP